MILAQGCVDISSPANDLEAHICKGPYLSRVDNPRRHPERHAHFLEQGGAALFTLNVEFVSLDEVHELVFPGRTPCRFFELEREYFHTFSM